MGEIWVDYLHKSPSSLFGREGGWGFIEKFSREFTEKGKWSFTGHNLFCRHGGWAANSSIIHNSSANECSESYVRINSILFNGENWPWDKQIIPEKTFGQSRQYSDLVLQQNNGIKKYLERIHNIKLSGCKSSVLKLMCSVQS